MPVVRVGPDETYRIVAGQPQLVGWTVDMDDRSDWGVVVAAYGSTEKRKVVALGIRADDVIHLLRWSAVEVDSERQRLRVMPAVSWRDPLVEDLGAPPEEPPPR